MTRPLPLPGQARLDRCRDELQFWRNYACLLPYTVRVDRDGERAARLAARIPSQRRPVDLRPRATPPGLPVRRPR